MSSLRRDNFKDFRGRTVAEPETGPSEERPTNLVSPALVEHLRSQFPDTLGKVPAGVPPSEVIALTYINQGRQDLIQYLDNLVRRD